MARSKNPAVPSSRRPPARRPPERPHEPKTEVDWEKLCRELRPDIDFPVVLELRTTLERPPG
jgi:hypothetical protein